MFDHEKDPQEVLFASFYLCDGLGLDWLTDGRSHGLRAVQRGGRPVGGRNWQEKGTAQRRSSVVVEEKRALDFDKVMDDDAGLLALLKFAQKEFNDEVLHFWLDIFRLKKDLADTPLWENGDPNAPMPEEKATGSGDSGGGMFNMFDGPEDNPFDADEASPARAPTRCSTASRPSPRQRRYAAIEGLLKRKCKYIIDTYLYSGAEYQVTMPDHPYKQPSSQGNYELTSTMFDEMFVRQPQQQHSIAEEQLAQPPFHSQPSLRPSC